jgi:predicted RNA binding protein YcfA (HicA-like mRNA interferase family)
MSQWFSAKATRVLAALLLFGWTIKRQTGSHKVLARPGWPNVVFAFHDKDEIGPKCSRVLPSTRVSNPMTSEFLRSNKY